jgi:hypothetical protein
MEAPSPEQFPYRPKWRSANRGETPVGAFRLERLDRSAHGAKMVCLFSVAGLWTAD